MNTRAILIVRYLLGVIFLFNGLNFILQFVPFVTPATPDIARRFIDLLKEARYFLPIISGVTVLTGLSLLTNRFLPLFLIIKFPLTVNGILYHIRMDPVMTPVALAAALMHFYLIYVNREKYFSMLDNGVK